MDGQRSMNLVVAQVLLAGTALGACEADLPLRRRLLKGLYEVLELVSVFFAPISGAENSDNGLLAHRVRLADRSQRETAGRFLK